MTRVESCRLFFLAELTVHLDIVDSLTEVRFQHKSLSGNVQSDGGARCNNFCFFSDRNVAELSGVVLGCLSLTPVWVFKCRIESLIVEATLHWSHCAYTIVHFS